MSSYLDEEASSLVRGVAVNSHFCMSCIIVKQFSAMHAANVVCAPYNLCFITVVWVLSVFLPSCVFPGMSVVVLAMVKVMYGTKHLLCISYVH